MNKGFSIVIATLLIASSFIGGILGYQIYRKVSQQQLGATIPKVVAVFETTLASKISSSATSMTLTSGTDKAGNSISGYMCFVLDEGTASEEFVCGTASSTSVTGMIRGIDPVDGDLEVSSLKKEHRRGASVKVTNYPQLAIISRVLNGDETLPNPLEYDSSVTTSTLAGNNQYVASVDYVNNVALFGAPDADLDTKGIVEIPTRSEVASGATHGSGDTSAYMCLPTDYAATSSSATTTIPITLSNGKLDQSFIDTSQDFNFTGRVTIATSTTQDEFNLLPAGVIVPYASSTPPDGWLLADGSEYATSSYPRLFAVIGYTYGGSGATFRVPDLRGRNIIGYGSATTTYDEMGETGGEDQHTLTIDELPPHTHSISTGQDGSDATGPYLQGKSGSSITGNVNTGSVGGGQPFNVMDPFIVLNYIIKY